MRRLTILSDLRCPDRIRNTREVGTDDFLYLETVAQRPECTPRAPTASREYLGSVGVGEEIHHLGVDYRAQ